MCQKILNDEDSDGLGWPACFPDDFNQVSLAYQVLLH